MNRIPLSLALCALTFAGAAAELPVPSGEAWPDVAAPCPVVPGVGPGWTDGTAARAAAGTQAVAPEVERGDGDLVTLRWRSLQARPVSDEIPLEVEDGTVGLTVRAEADRDRFLISVELLGPDGALLACHDCEDAPAVGEVREGRGTVQMPSTDRPGWQLVPGRYAFRVRALPRPDHPQPDEQGTDVDVTVTLRSDASVTVQRYVDLNFVYLPGSALSVDIAEHSPMFADVLARLDEWLAPTGIRIGRVTHHDLDLDTFSRIATWDEAGELFDTSGQVGEPRAVNVYCVRGFIPPLLNVVGLSGGIPGPSFNGTHDSGIIVRTSPIFKCHDCVDAFASLFAHELGHFFGLYHTTEANQEAADPFGDTPLCEERSLRDCPDYDYVMFPLIHSSNVIWSPGEISVVRTHPIVYTVPVLRPAAAVRAPGRDVIAQPNPFRESVELVLRAGEQAPATASVYDVAGRKVRELDPFRGRVVWDGRDADGARVPGGVYFARVTDGTGTRTVRIVRTR